MKNSHNTTRLITIIILLFLASCGGKTDNLYPDTNTQSDIDGEILPDGDNIGDMDNTDDSDSQTLGTVGDACQTKDDCIQPLLCVNYHCAGTLYPDKDVIQDKDIIDEDSNFDEDIDTSLSDNDTIIIDESIDEDGDAVDDEWLDWDGTAICGNGIVEPGENCDDKNARDDDYCGNDCLTVNGACGDGTVQKYELCDDGNTDDGDYCSADCLSITGACGDETVQTGETCDDGDDNGKYGFCSLQCDGLGLGCGDGVLQGNRERCDDGNNDDGDYCSPDCQTIIGACGDNIIQPTLEICDDGNHLDGDYCSADCQTQDGSCGDGVKQSWEECEDGNTTTESCTYGETTACTICNGICLFIPGQITYCGDGVRDISNFEMCDDGDENGNYGKCNSDCTGSAAHCGDGTIDVPYEICESEDITDCSTLGSGYMDGETGCKSDCSAYDSTSCDIFKPSTLFGTGITECYNAIESITCPYAFDDFFGQEGNFNYTLIATTSETIDGDVVVSDLSDTMWQGTLPALYAGCTEGDPVGSLCTAPEATTYCENLTYANFSDWTLPPVENFSFYMADYQTAPHIATNLASLSEATSYWSATIHETNQWIYDLSDTTTSLVSQINESKVRCVRNLPAQTIYDSISFTYHNISGEIYYSEAYSHIDWTPPVTATTTWQNALSYCIALSHAGFTDWRLPTERELLILSNTEHYSPASTFPDISKTASYWSSTTSVEANETAFVVDMMDGSTKTAEKTALHPFYCVRVR